MKNKMCKINIVIIIIFLIAFILRIIYISNTSITSEKQHDIIDKNGHLDYILEIYNNKLPSSNQNQYYHPPLHHIICASFLKLVDGFIKNKLILYESLKVLTLIYSMLIIFVVKKILKEIKINEKYQYLILCLIAFHPTFIILSASINNDILSILLIFYSLYRLIKWHKNQNLKNTIVLAIITGLAVMTKTSTAILSVPILYIFILDFFRNVKKAIIKKKTITKYFNMFFIFGLLSLSIGLWYPIRNYMLFEQDILYVLEPSIKKLYVGDYNLLSRFIPFSKEMFLVYCNPYSNYNIPTYIIKCSLFGEFTWGYDSIISMLSYWMAILSNIILIAISLFSMIKVMILKNKKDTVYNNMFFLLYLINIISFVIMNIKLPYGCSMDFRYIVSTIFLGSYFIVKYFQTLENKQNNIESITILLLIILLISSNYIIFCS